MLDPVCSLVKDVIGDDGEFNHLAAAPPSAIVDLIDLIYEAAADASRWRQLVDAYLEAVGGSRGCLILDAGSRKETALVRCSGWSDEDARLYADCYVADAMSRSTATEQKEGELKALDLTNRADLSCRSSSHRRRKTSGNIRYELSCVFFSGPCTSSAMVAARSEREGPFTEPAFELLNFLIPHLRRAIVLQSELSLLRTQLAAFNAHLDRCPYPFLLMDPQGCITYANVAALEAAGLRDGLAICSAQLSFLSSRDQLAYAEALKQVAAETGPAFCRVEVKRRSLKSPYTLLLIPITHPTPLSNGPRSAISVLIIDREGGPEMDPAILRELFHLTPTEARVTAKLGSGWSAEQIACEMGISLETARTHIRHILSKTATARQGELIALVLRTAAFRLPPRDDRTYPI